MLESIKKVNLKEAADHFRGYLYDAAKNNNRNSIGVEVFEGGYEILLNTEEMQQELEAANISADDVEMTVYIDPVLFIGAVDKSALLEVKNTEGSVFSVKSEKYPGKMYVGIDCEFLKDDIIAPTIILINVDRDTSRLGVYEESLTSISDDEWAKLIDYISEFRYSIARDYSVAPLHVPMVKFAEIHSAAIDVVSKSITNEALIEESTWRRVFDIIKTASNSEKAVGMTACVAVNEGVYDFYSDLVLKRDGIEVQEDYMFLGFDNGGPIGVEIRRYEQTEDEHMNDVLLRFNLMCNPSDLDESFCIIKVREDNEDDSDEFDPNDLMSGLTLGEVDDLIVNIDRVMSDMDLDTLIDEHIEEHDDCYYIALFNVGKDFDPSKYTNFIIPVNMSGITSTYFIVNNKFGMCFEDRRCPIPLLRQYIDVDTKDIGTADLVRISAVSMKDEVIAKLRELVYGDRS